MGEKKDIAQQNRHIHNGMDMSKREWVKKQKKIADETNEEMMTTQEYLTNLHLNFICLCTHRCLTYEKDWPWYYIHNSSIMPMSVSFWFHFLFFFPYSHLLLFVPYLHRIADEVYGVFVSTYEPHNRHLHSSLFCNKDKEHFIVITSHALRFHAEFLIMYLLSLSSQWIRNTWSLYWHDLSNAVCWNRVRSIKSVWNWAHLLNH